MLLSERIDSQPGGLSAEPDAQALKSGSTPERSEVGVQVRLVRGPGMLRHLGSPLDELHEATGVPITARRPWLQAWIDAYQDHQPFGVTVAGPSGHLEGAALLARRRAGRLTEIVALGHGPSDYARLPARGQAAARVLAGGVVCALRDTRGPWQLRLEQLPRGDAVAREIKAGLRWTMLVPGEGAPRMCFGEDRTPNAHLSRNHRQNVRKSWNRIRREGLDAAIVHERDAGEIGRLVPQIEGVRRERDLTLRGRSDLEDSRMAAFWRTVIIELARRGEVELTLLRMNGQLAAYALCLLDGDASRMWDGRVSPRWKRFAAGRLVNNESILQALKDPVLSQYDLMRGLEDYKLSLSTDVVGAEHLLGWSSLPVATSWGLPLAVKSVLRPAKERHPFLARAWEVLKSARVRGMRRLTDSER